MRCAHTRAPLRARGRRGVRPPPRLHRRLCRAFTDAPLLLPPRVRCAAIDGAARVRARRAARCAPRAARSPPPDGCKPLRLRDAHSSRPAVVLMAAELTESETAALDAALARIKAADGSLGHSAFAVVVSELQNASLPAVRTHLCGIVRALAFGDTHSEYRTGFLGAGAAEVLLEVLCKSLQSPQTVEAALEALTNLVPAADWLDRTADAAALEAMKVLRGPLSSNDDVTVAACMFLFNACVNNLRLSIKVCDAGGLQLFVAAMQRYPECERLQLGACTALHCLGDTDSADGRWDSDAARAAIVAVLAVMAASPAVLTAQQKGCLALAAILRSRVPLQVHAVQLGGVEAIVTALTMHAADADVAESACLALGNVAGRFTQVTSRTAAAALDAVLSALRTHADHLLTQRHGMLALFALLEHKRLRQYGESNLEVVLTGMKTFRADFYVQSVGCMVICRSAQLQEHFRVFAGTAGALKVVVRVLRTCAAAAPHPAVTSVEQLQLGTCSHASFWAKAALLTLLQNQNGVPNQLRALHAGALILLQTSVTEVGARNETTEKLVHALEMRATQHNQQHGGGCSECAAMRANGKMCGLAGCTVRWRANGGSLPLCAGCHKVAYCCREHQKEAWRASHKAECGKAARC